jgi:hypothetical protein
MLLPDLATKGDLSTVKQELFNAIENQTLSRSRSNGSSALLVMARALRRTQVAVSSK